MTDPLLQRTNDRFSLFPIQYPHLWDLYKKAEASFWTPEEIDLADDLRQWEKLTADEKHFITHVLAFFAGSDGVIMENLGGRFLTDIMLPEARCFYAFQLANEAQHCVVPETHILTRMGHKRIGDLADTEVDVWNGHEWSGVTVRKTGTNEAVLKVVLSNGMELQCTHGHKFLVRQGPRAHPEMCTVTRVVASELQTGDVVARWELPVVDPPDPDELRNPYTHGFWTGDGTYSNNYPYLALYGAKKKLLPHLSISSSRDDKQGRVCCYLTDQVNKDKFFVPLDYSVTTKLRWLEGWLDADGCVHRTVGGHTTIQAVSVKRNFLAEVQLLLASLGVLSSVRFQRAAGEYLLPDGKGGSALYWCETCYVMYIPSAAVHTLRGIGFAPRRLAISASQVCSRGVPRLVTVVSVTNKGRRADTYCFTEPKRHTGVFNGILTGQSETYALLLDAYVKDGKEKSRLFRAIDTMPAVKQKADWAMRWIEGTQSFAQRLVAFAAVEGIFFSGSFCSIFWLKKRGLMPGLTFSNELISR